MRLGEGPDAAGEWVGEVERREHASSRLERLRDAERGERSAVRASDGPLRALRVAPRPAWMTLPGVECLPPCRWCGAPTVWRGGWHCDACLSRHAISPDYSKTRMPRSLPVEALAGVPLVHESLAGEGPARVFSSGEGHNSFPGKKGLDALEALTSFSRRARAARLIARGARPCVDGSVELSAWHGARAGSLADRAARWRRCGELLYVAEGPEGRVVPVEYRCGDWRACPRCRSRRRYTAQRDARRVRDLAMRLYRRETSRYYSGEEGRHSEKLITLTVPHSGSVNNDVALMRRAMARFMRGLTDHVNGLVCRPGKYGNLSAFPWYRTYEVAATNELHVHAHLWVLAPFLDHVVLRVMWGQALLREGLARERMPFQEWGEEGELLPWPVLDIRSAHGVDYAAKVGLTDYVAKVDGVKESLAPSHFAAAYEALSDLRVAQWAMGWCPSERAMGWCVRRATQAERDEWYARLSAALGLCEVASARNDAGSVVRTRDVETLAWPRDGPEKATAPNTADNSVGADQLSLFGGNSEAIVQSMVTIRDIGE